MGNNHLLLIIGAISGEIDVLSNRILKNNQYRTKIPYYLIQNTENSLKIAFFLYSRPKIAVFQNFHTRFFDGHFFGLQEGSMKSEILLPPMPSFENLVSVLSLVWLAIKIFIYGIHIAHQIDSWNAA